VFGDPWLRQYSLKANQLSTVVARLGDRGWGANVVSVGEWDAARAAGLPNSRISFEGIGKTDAALRRIAAASRDGDPLLWVSIESADEAAVLADLARLEGLGTGDSTRIEVLLRLNPDVRPDTHPGLAVGLGSSKFGMTSDEIESLVGSGVLDPAIFRLRGIHVHVGSQLGSTEAWVHGACAGRRLLATIEPTVPTADTLDIGGGFPVALEGPWPRPAEFAADLKHGLAAEGLELPARCAIEPGRYLVAEAGWILASVLHARRREGTALVVLDAGMTELIRPALYGAHHPIIALGATDAVETCVDTTVDGPVCESADTFGQYRLPTLTRGSLVALANTGAYGAVFASNYNGRPLASQIVIESDGSIALLRAALPALHS
jgi:diaminopimelate decarboxylase